MERHPKVNPPDLARCPHCGNITSHQCTHREDYSVLIEQYDDYNGLWDECWWAILKCTTCGKLSLYHDDWDNERKRWKASLAYPIPQSAPPEVPTFIRDTFDEAISIFQKAPSLAAVGIRKCLEGIANDQRAEGRTLGQRIKYLSDRGVIPQTLIEMMDISRGIGNIGAHYSKSTVTLDEIRTLIEFTLAIFEYIYVAPSKIEIVRRSLETKRAS